MELKKKLRGIFSLSAASAALLQNSASASSNPIKLTPDKSANNNPQSFRPAPDKLILEQADLSEIAKLYAAHGSHSSHSSHSSHYSGSSAPAHSSHASHYSSSGYSAPAPNYGYSAPVSPPPTSLTPTPVVKPAPKKDDPDYAARLLETKKQWADEGLPSYQYEIGMMYLTGNGLEKDESKGRKYIALAAAQGYEDAVKKWKELSRVDSSQPAPTNTLSTNSTPPLEKIETNQSKAASQPDVITKLLAKAASGSASAQFELGLRYAKGLGVEKNLEKGKSYLEMAAAQGNSEATALLDSLKAAAQ